MRKFIFYSFNKFLIRMKKELNYSKLISKILLQQNSVDVYVSQHNTNFINC